MKMTVSLLKIPRRRNPSLAILVGGSIAGTIDLLVAIHAEGFRTLLGVAAGLLGRQAMHGGTPVYIVGLCLHFFIAMAAATVYYGCSRFLPFLSEYPLVCGLCFGAAVQLFMNLIVLPLSALHLTGPFTLRSLIAGLLLHMIVIGLPISYSISKFSRNGSSEQH
jgi:hypothetical protein